MEQKKRDQETWPKLFAILGFLGLMQVIGSLFVLLLAYDVVVIIFKYAFGVQLWNPFH